MYLVFILVFYILRVWFLILMYSSPIVLLFVECMLFGCATNLFLSLDCYIFLTSFFIKTEND